MRETRKGFIRDIGESVRASEDKLNSFVGVLGANVQDHQRVVKNNKCY